MRNLLWSLALPLCAWSLIACGDSSGTGGSGGGGTCPDNLVPVPNTEFCTAGAAEVDCDLVTAEKNALCGIAIVDPQAELARATDVEEFAGQGAPDVSCFSPGNYPPAPGTSQMATVEGFARIFSSGCNSGSVSITFHQVVRDGGPNDGQLGAVVGSTVVTPADCELASGSEQNEVDGCVDPRWECRYSYPNVPTETELAVRTEGGETWAPLIQYNVFIPNSEVVAGTWEHNVRALAAPDYSVIPQTAMGSPITPGNGAVAGEVHDCGDVRLLNAVVNIDKQKRALTYFTSNEDSPLPDLGAKATSKLGLYATLDVPPGQVSVASLGTVGGAVVPLGQHKVWVYPDTVTSVTFKGLRPYQLP